MNFTSYIVRIATFRLSVENSSFIGCWIEPGIKDKVLDSIEINYGDDDLERGVLVHTIETDVEKIVKQIVSKVEEISTIITNQFGYKVFQLLIKFGILKSNKFVKQITSIKTETKDEITLIPKSYNVINLEPENKFYDGYIISFENFLPHERITVFEAYPVSDDVVITNQTNYEYERYKNEIQTGTLIVIHTSEETKIELQFYTYTTHIKENKSYVSNFSAKFGPEEYTSLDPELEFKAYTDDKVDIMVDSNYFEYLYQECNESIKEVYELLSDLELSKMFFDNFLESSKIAIGNKSLSYTKDSII